MNKNAPILISIIIIVGGIAGYTYWRNSAPIPTAGAPVVTPSTPPAASTPKTISASEVSTHNSASSCYSIIDGTVYDLTSWISKHPGGARAILSICGKDGSALFQAQHGESGRIRKLLTGFEIGTLGG